jgi:hypothetical protein
MRRLILTIIFIFIFSTPVYGEVRENTGDLNEDMEIIDISDFSGTFIKEEQLPKSELKEERFFRCS